MIYKNKFKQLSNICYEKISANPKTPLVGVFILVEGKIFIHKEGINKSYNFNNYYDAGNLFHIDLMKDVANSNQNFNIKEKTIKYLKGTNCATGWPRGRLCYKYSSNEYEIFACEEIIRNDLYLKEICEAFHIKGKINRYIDNCEYKSIFPLGEIK